MRLRNNRGYVMTDVSIAIIVLLILVPTIMGLIYSISVTRRTTETKAQAINIVTNVIEAAKGIDINSLDGQEILESLERNEQSIYYGEMGIINNEVINGKTVSTAVIKKADKESYKVYVDVIDYHDENEEAEANILKIVTAIVKFKVSGQEKEISLKTVIK